MSCERAAACELGTASDVPTEALGPVMLLRANRNDRWGHVICHHELSLITSLLPVTSLALCHPPVSLLGTPRPRGNCHPGLSWWDGPSRGKGGEPLGDRGWDSLGDRGA